MNILISTYYLIILMNKFSSYVFFIIFMVCLGRNAPHGCILVSTATQHNIALYDWLISSIVLVRLQREFYGKQKRQLAGWDRSDQFN
jgi:hypothetical protein